MSNTFIKSDFLTRLYELNFQNMKFLYGIIMPIFAVTDILSKTELTHKVKILVILSLFSSPITYLMKVVVDWATLNAAYIFFVLFAIIFDYFLITVYHIFYKKNFSIKRNFAAIFEKTFLTIAVGFTFEGIMFILRISDSSYVNSVMRILVFLYPVESIFRSSFAMSGGIFPPKFFMDKIEEAKKTLDIGKMLFSSLISNMDLKNKIKENKVSKTKSKKE